MAISTPSYVNIRKKNTISRLNPSKTVVFQSIFLYFREKCRIFVFVTIINMKQNE